MFIITTYFEDSYRVGQKQIAQFDNEYREFAIAFAQGISVNCENAVYVTDTRDGSYVEFLNGMQTLEYIAPNWN